MSHLYPDSSLASRSGQSSRDYTTLRKPEEDDEGLEAPIFAAPTRTVSPHIHLSSYNGGPSKTKTVGPEEVPWNTELEAGEVNDSAVLKKEANSGRTKHVHWGAQANDHTIEPTSNAVPPRPNAQPGAISIDGPAPHQAIPPRRPTVNTTQRHEASGEDHSPVLLSATLVSENLDHASSARMEAIGDLVAEAKPLRRSYNPFIILAALLVFVIAGVVVSVVLTSNSKNNDDPEPTSSPTQAPLPKIIGTWEPVGNQLVGEAGIEFFGAGSALSSDGTVLVVGAPGGSREGATQSGRATIYEFNESSWQQKGNSIGGFVTGDFFGWAVDMSADGNVVVVGAIQFLNVLDQGASGYACVYIFNSTHWNQLGQVLQGEEQDENFGTSVSISANGQTVAVGAPFYGGDGLFEAGRVETYGYDMSSGQWVKVGQTLTGNAIGDEFGLDIELSADGLSIAVGANQFRSPEPRAGFVQIFDYAGSMWEKRGRQLQGKAPLSEFGWSVALSADASMVAVGAPQSDTEDVGKESGRVRVFRYNETQTDWDQVGNDIIGRYPFDDFGIWVAMSGDGLTLAAGAWNSSSQDPGYLRVFRLMDEDQWYQIGDDIIQAVDGESIFNEFGLTVHVSQDASTVSMGTPFFDVSETGSDVGQIQVFRMKNFSDSM